MVVEKCVVTKSNISLCEVIGRNQVKERKVDIYEVFLSKVEPQHYNSMK